MCLECFLSNSCIEIFKIDHKKNEKIYTANLKAAARKGSEKNCREKAYPYVKVVNPQV